MAEQTFVMHTPYGNVPIVMSLPESGDERVTSVPMSANDCWRICLLYMDESPFFDKYLRSVMDALGSDSFTFVMNEYLENVQYKTGTFAYYKHWLFGARKWRDNLKKFLDFRCKFPRLASSTTSSQQRCLPESSSKPQL